MKGRKITQCCKIYKNKNISIKIKLKKNYEKFKKII